MKKLLIALLVTVCFVLVWRYFTYRKTNHLPEGSEALLYALGTKAGRTNDVPVGAILYKGKSIMGSGYNTVAGENNPTGHAEINALTAAMKRLGYQTFQSLCKDSLLMISSYEPCPMCTHTLASYGIYRVVYVEKKSFWYCMRHEWWPGIKFLFTRRQADSDVQQKMFREAIGS